MFYYYSLFNSHPSSFDTLLNFSGKNWWVILALFENFECKLIFFFSRSRDVISKGRLARDEDGLVRDTDELPRGEDGLARGEDELVRGEDGLARSEDELERADDYRKLKDQHKGRIFLSPFKIFQYILASKFVYAH